MAIRRPVNWNGTGFQDFTDAEMAAVQLEIIRLYGVNPSVVLSVVSSGGSLGNLTDTRLQAGAGTTDVTDFDTVGELQDVSTISVTWGKVNQALSGIALDKANFSYPVYRVSGGVRAMTSTDFYDTFIDPALATLSGSDSGTSTAGTYTISSTTSLSGATEVSGSNTAIFVDTRADADAYTADGLSETRDQPENITSYYLHRHDQASAGAFTKYVCHTPGSGDCTHMSRTNIRKQLRTAIQYHAEQELSYNFSSGTSRGTAIIDTARTNSKYLTFQVDANDYRAQEVPDEGLAAQTITTYRLYINRS